MRRLVVGLVVAAGCTSSGAVFHGRDAGVQDTGPTETGPAAGSGGGGGSSGLGGIGATGGGGTGGGGTGGGPWDPTVGAISAGNDYIVTAFPTAAGVIVVRGGHIEIVSRAGTSLALLTTPRENLAASFDGTELIVSDRAMLTAYDTSLAFLGQTPVNEPCNTIDAVAGRIVCQGWYSVYRYYSYAPRTGAAPIPSLAFTSSSNVGDGPVVRVPGRQQILTLDNGGLVLHDVSASGVVSDVAGYVAAYPGSVTFGPRFVAFDGSPAKRLLADNGKFYRLGPADCITTDPQTCLTEDGALEPRTTPVEIIVNAVGDGAGHFLVLRTPTYAVQKPFCALGCVLDSIDAATGKVDRTTTVRLSITKPVSAQYDPAIDGMVIGYQSPDGDRVSLLDFSAHTDTVGPEPYAANGPAPVLPPLDSPLSGCAPSKRLVDGPARVVTAAPVSGGLLLVTEEGLFRMDRAGNVLTTVTRGQPVLTGVFDAGMLVIGDAQGLAIYDPSLRLLRQISVTNGCQTVAVLSASHVVCESRDPIYMSAATVLTYAADSGALLASNAQDALGQLGDVLRLRRVPGVEALVARSSIDPVYRLFGTASDGAVSFVNSTLSLGFTPGMPFAFWGSGRSGTQPAHLIGWSGTVFKIYNPDCLSTGPPFESGCFVPDAEVGTQRSDHRFVAIESDRNDLYAISSGSDLYAPATACPDDCYLIQHLDLPSRRVVSSRLQSIHLGEQALEIAHDAECGMILVTSVDGFDTQGGSGGQYFVDLLDYGGS